MQGGGVCKVSELVDYISNKLIPKYTDVNALRKALSTFDSTGSGYIGIDELTFFLTAFGKDEDSYFSDKFEKFINCCKPLNS